MYKLIYLALIIAVFLSSGNSVLAQSASQTKEIKTLSLSYFPVKSCSSLNQKLNLSLASATSNRSPVDASVPPSKAIDGIFTTKWSPVTPYIGANIQIDLGSQQTFKALVPYFWSSDRPESYHIDVSQTGQFAGEQVRVVTETAGLTGYYNAGGALERKDYIFNTVTARYIRLTIDKYRNANTSEGQVNLYEFEVYQNVDSKNCLDTSVTGDVGFTSNPSLIDPLDGIKQRVKNHNAGIIAALNEGSKYHGYKNPSAVAATRHILQEEKEFLLPIPVSTQYPGRPDYRKLLNDNNICNYVDNLGVRDVFVWSYHTDQVAPEESDMAMGTDSRAFWNETSKTDVKPNATYGDISNSSQVPNLPVCQKTYTLFNFVYGPSYGNAVHNYLHQIENVMGFANREMFWDMYVGRQYTFAGPRRCGHSHTPPNSSKDYGYDDQTFGPSDCEDWKPVNCINEPLNSACGGTKLTFNCSKWECNDVKYYIWWMQNLPGLGNTLSYNGQPLRNWWELMADFDQGMAGGKSLVTATAPSASPSPSPRKPGDADGDNDIDIFDYNYVVSNFGKNGQGITGDVDNDGDVDIFDYNMVLTYFGT